MVEIKLMSACTFEHAQQAWNDGFSGYARDLTMDLSTWLHRCAREDLLPDLSVIAFDGSNPVGFVISGLREMNGELVVWNGGTAIAPAYRGQGIGNLLMEASLQLYRRHGAQLACLEALEDNVQAIKLYEKLGYSVIDKLFSLEKSGDLILPPLTPDGSYKGEPVRPRDLGGIPFYNHLSPWHCQWQSIQDGEAVLVKDSKADTVGYALFRREFNEAGQLLGIALYQCEVDAARVDQTGIFQTLLSHVFSPLSVDCRRHTVNIPAANAVLLDMLRRAGFETAMTEVHMTQRF
ncbi:MAG: hypothetical protein A2201_02940 [Alicyclobacillus sp. RIFOXYA1_FULL_53_8]|nr:MAG: hypothetical protein A2201_02940 [Alicyclobacillus sp. RIFOXYA1_FULL_53_8]